MIHNARQYAELISRLGCFNPNMIDKEMVSEEHIDTIIGANQTLLEL